MLKIKIKKILFSYVTSYKKWYISLPVQKKGFSRTCVTVSRGRRSRHGKNYFGRVMNDTFHNQTLNNIYITYARFLNIKLYRFNSYQSHMFIYSITLIGFRTYKIVELIRIGQTIGQIFL